MQNYTFVLEIPYLLFRTLLFEIIKMQIIFIDFLNSQIKSANLRIQIENLSKEVKNVLFSIN